MKELKFKTGNGYSVYIPLSSAITVLLGDSGTGKSFIFNELNTGASERKLSFKCACFSPDNCTTLLDILKSDYKGLIVLDDFDILVKRFPELMELLNKQSHQVLLIGRDIDGLYANIHYVFHIVQNGKELGVRSAMSKKEWYGGGYVL